MLEYLLYLISGLLGASIMVLWGVYGDLLIEDFEIRKVFRSLSLGLIWASFLFLVKRDLPYFIVALIVIAFERFTTEVYKALLRDERQVKYKIPSDLDIDFPRWIEKVFGIVLIIGLGIVFVYVNFKADIWLLLIVASLAPALGGMMKDAPYEGFFPFKFFRSPLIIIFVALLLTYLYPNLEDKYFLMSLWGGERIISEYYKKILRGNIPGKFKRDVHHHISHAWKEKRKILLVPYLLCLSGLVFLLNV